MSMFAPIEPPANRWVQAWSGRRRWPLVSAAGGIAAAALVLLRTMRKCCPSMVRL
ncbi:MAG TPA: hypothetical protein VN892_12880 [Solirubrobacteraceae bacterium]|nr:hypothetical protein [Solirubrobacteraceae bacterium]